MSVGFTIHRPGRVRWRDAWELQKSLAARVAVGKSEAHLILVEHDPVLTLGRHARKENILVPAAELARRGIDVEPTTRGGDVTWHGPGQVVGYPILHLPSHGLRVADFVHGLESAMARACASFGVHATPTRSAIGTWVGEKKIGSVGIHVSRGITTHGFALNSCPDLAAFSLIHPCGMPACLVTSLALETKRSIGWAEAATAMEHAMGELLQASSRS